MSDMPLLRRKFIVLGKNQFKYKVVWLTLADTKIC